MKEIIKWNGDKVLAYEWFDLPADILNELIQEEGHELEQDGEWTQIPEHLALESLNAQNFLYTEAGDIHLLSYECDPLQKDEVQLYWYERKGTSIWRQPVWLNALSFQRKIKER